jgi:hypothetical protein
MALTEKQGLEDALANINEQIALVVSQIRTTQNSSLFSDAEKAPRLAQLRAELAVLQATQSRLIAALNQLNLNDRGNTSSAADITREGQVARDDNALPQAPGPGLQKEIAADGRIKDRVIVSETNATKTATTENGAVDTGTNAEVRKLSVTQSIPSPAQSGPLKAVPAQPVVSAQSQEAGIYSSNSGGGSGIGSTNEDGSQKPSTFTQNLLDNLYGSNNIVAEENVLDQYPSYTYNLSWYLLSPTSYTDILSAKNRGTSGRYLLAQSGGAPVQNASPTQSGTVGVGRNPNFYLDYYLDDFFVDILYSGTPGSRGASALSEIGFTVTEPNGITLLPNLYSAITDLYQAEGITSSEEVNYAAAHYCMVIRFYGYDANGNLMLPVTGKVAGSADNYAVVEKVIPFLITSIDFKVANKLVEYTVKAISPGQATGLSTDRASIPNNFQFQGATVNEMLVGGVQQQTVAVLDEGRAGGDGTWSV